MRQYPFIVACGNFDTTAPASCFSSFGITSFARTGVGTGTLTLDIGRTVPDVTIDYSAQGLLCDIQPGASATTWDVTLTDDAGVATDGSFAVEFIEIPPPNTPASTS